MSQTPSFRQINYSLRPGKNVERKMLAETLARLSAFRPLPEYSYVGFGSVWFADFSLFHRQFGFTPMYSIEGDEEGRDRAQFNVPFGCIHVLPGRSETVLPTLPFDRPTVVWLDYDTELHGNVLQDVATVVTRQCEAGFSGVFLAITVDVETKRLAKPKSATEEDLEDWPEDDPLSQFRKLLGERDTPANLNPSDLQGEKFADVCRTIVTQKILTTLTMLNGIEEPDKRWEYHQLANFRYADGAAMATFGGLIFRSCDRPCVETAQFVALPFVRTAADPYVIDVPLLTFREVDALNCQAVSETDRPDVPVSTDDREKLAKVYRYFPAFIEAEL